MNSYFKKVDKYNRLTKKVSILLCVLAVGGFFSVSAQANTYLCIYEVVNGNPGSVAVDGSGVAVVVSAASVKEAQDKLPTDFRDKVGTNYSSGGYLQMGRYACITKPSDMNAIRVVQ